MEIIQLWQNGYFELLVREKKAVQVIKATPTINYSQILTNNSAAQGLMCFLAFCVFADFGVEEITLLAGHFHKVLETTGVAPVAVEHEWGLLKVQLHRKATWQDLTWTHIHGLFTSTCLSVLHLMNLLMTIPVANAECERGFSIG